METIYRITDTRVGTTSTAAVGRLEPGEALKRLLHERATARAYSYRAAHFLVGASIYYSLVDDLAVMLGEKGGSIYAEGDGGTIRVCEMPVYLGDFLGDEEVRVVLHVASATHRWAAARAGEEVHLGDEAGEEEAEEPVEEETE